MPGYRFETDEQIATGDDGFRYGSPISEFDPAQIASLVHRYRTNNASTRWIDRAGTVPASSGDVLGRISDEVGSEDLVAPSDAARPLLAMPAGTTVLAQCDGVDDTLIASGILITDDNTIVTIMKKTAKTCGLFDGTTTGTFDRSYMLQAFSGNDYRYVGRGVAITGNGPALTGDYRAVEGQALRDANAIYEDGGLLNSGTYTDRSITLTGLRWGSEATANASFFYDGDLVEMLVFDAELTGEEREALQAYFVSTYSDLGIAP